jgi:hypothetical protein
MTDRELLELAAKAAGISVWWNGRTCFLLEDGVAKYEWNPLDDDGTALRLAVRLELWIFAPDIDDLKVHVRLRNEQVSVAEKVVDNPWVSTRRAIVRAAAEIGRGMP